MSSQHLLTSLLKDVSRSFYLTLRVLPANIRNEIGLAYLLARASDTIADTGLVAAPQRSAALGKFRARILGKSNETLQLGELVKNQSSAAERKLLERADDAVALLGSVSAEDQQRIREVLTVIISGQELDLIRFAHANSNRILALQSDGELDGYTYRVAGCVGEFWTKMWWSRLYPDGNASGGGGLTVDSLQQHAVRYGKGLQLVNILRDFPEDLRRGRCYLPKEKLSAANLTPEMLLSASNEAAFRGIYNSYLDRAEEYLRVGWGYTNVLPKKQWRLRLATAWPVLIGVKTISKLRKSPILGTSAPVKISRGEVRGVMFGSFLGLLSEARWKKQFSEIAR